MNNILKNALNFFKENNFKCETTNIDGQYKFYIDDDCYYYINDIYKINPIKYISNNDIDDILNISILEEIFNFLDKKLFLKINDIFIIKNNKDIKKIEKRFNRKFDTDNFLGFCTYDTNTILINLLNIINLLKKQNLYIDQFIYGLAQEFIITLVHELAHSCLKDEILVNEYYTPFSEDMLNNYNDEEELVEKYANIILNKLNKKYNLEYIFKLEKIILLYF